MLRFQHKITIMNNHDDMPLPEARNHILTGSHKLNLAKKQYKGSITVIINYFKDINEDMNKCLNEDYKNINKQLNENNLRK